LNQDTLNTFLDKLLMVICRCNNRDQFTHFGFLRNNPYNLSEFNSPMLAAMKVNNSTFAVGKNI
jgi:hypothetical protein